MSTNKATSNLKPRLAPLKSGLSISVEIGTLHYLYSVKNAPGGPWSIRVRVLCLLPPERGYIFSAAMLLVHFYFEDGFVCVYNKTSASRQWILRAHRPWLAAAISTEGALSKGCLEC